MTVISWFAPPPPAVTEIDLQVPVQDYERQPGLSRLSSDENGTVPLGSFGQPIALQVHSIRLESQPPRAISIPIGRPEVRVRSFAFAAEAEPVAPAPPENGPSSSPRSFCCGGARW